MMKISYIDINKLKPHEKISKKRLENLSLELIKDGFLKKPLIVENKKFIILDGHHRFYLLKKLGVKKVPCYIVDYDKIAVFPRRKKFKEVDLKKLVYETVLKNKLLPYKTTKHLVKFSKEINFKLNFHEK